SNLLAILSQSAEPHLAGMILRRLARCADAKGHVGVLGIGEDEFLATRWIGVDCGELSVERFHLSDCRTTLQPFYILRPLTSDKVCLSTFPLCRSACSSFGHSSISRVPRTPARPTIVGTLRATSRRP